MSKRRSHTRHSRANIRDLNDAFRTTLEGGHILITPGVAELGITFHREVIAQVRAFADFDEGNDPCSEHDFGALNVRGKTVFFKIDYYGLELASGSPEPADLSVTTRVLTIMLAGEY